MARYAEGTSVPAENSIAEIQKTVARFGASGFGYGYEGDQVMVMFKVKGRQVRFFLTIPDRKDFARTPPPAQRLRTADMITKAHGQAVRERYRALALIIKAKLAAVEAGIREFDQEFMADLVLPGEGKTVGQRWLEPVRAAIEGGAALPLLPYHPKD